ncbi:MAG: DEAD/DEAH box helicase [Bacteroidaceae bacterium]|nr:DEAD/DEAH box helicase [Bacteroidaceae bacterium]
MDFILADIIQHLEVQSLNPMQEKMLSANNEDKDLLLLSPTGSGKTLAYMLPLCQQINNEIDTLQVLVIVPSRELALQSEDVLKKMRLPIRSMSVYGGRPAMEEHRRLREVKPHVLFATPGRLLDHIEKENISLFAIKLVVVDEFDKSLELGFSREMMGVAVRLPRKGVKRICLSATDVTSESVFQTFVETKKLLRLDFSEQDTEENRLTMYSVVSPVKDKLQTLAELLTFIAGRPTIVFVAHRESVDRVSAYLHSLGFYVESYHGGLDQEQRERSLYKFRSGGSNVLVSTDLASRGLDIPEVSAVVHYHLPLTEDVFTHRCGRATRWENTGDAYLILSPEEKLPQFVESVEQLSELPVHINPVLPKWTTLYIGRGKKEKLSKIDIVGLLCKKGGLRAEEIGRIDVKDHKAYVAVLRKKVRLLLNNIRGEKIKGMKTLIEEMRS